MNIIKQTRTITTTHKVNDVALDAFVYDDKFRQIREKSRNPMNKCFVCKRKFEDNEKISLLLIDKGNKVSCNNCAVKLQK